MSVPFFGREGENRELGGRGGKKRGGEEKEVLRLLSMMVE
jgi:hypothetical protein